MTAEEPGKVFLNWSSGKDAALALYRVRQENVYRVDKLVTTVNSEEGSVSMHGLRSALLRKQAESLGICLLEIPIGATPATEVYNSIMYREMSLLKDQGFTHGIFGDIHLEDIRSYRTNQLKKVGLEALFPLWMNSPVAVVEEVIRLGFKAVTVCVDASKLDKSFCGRIIDRDFLLELPPNVDPAGENGEYHSFVFDGPGFRNPVDFQKGKIREVNFESGKTADGSEVKGHSWSSRFWYCDLLPIP